MKQLPSELQIAMERFGELQERHLRDCGSWDRPWDAARNYFERSQAVAELKNQLQVFLKTLREGDADDGRTARLCRDGIASILAKEGELAASVTARSRHVQNEIKQLLKGRKALRGYGLAVQRGRPFHVSDNG